MVKISLPDFESYILNSKREGDDVSTIKTISNYWREKNSRALLNNSILNDKIITEIGTTIIFEFGGKGCEEKQPYLCIAAQENNVFVIQPKFDSVLKIIFQKDRLKKVYSKIMNEKTLEWFSSFRGDLTYTSPISTGENYFFITVINNGILCNYFAVSGLDESDNVTEMNIGNMTILNLLKLLDFSPYKFIGKPFTYKDAIEIRP